MSDRRHARTTAVSTPARAPLARAGRAAAQGKASGPSPLERYLGSTIRELRRKHGLTIADISERTGISRGMLSRIETGQTATSLDTLSRLAQGLGVSLSALFRNYDLADGGVQLVKKGKGMEVARRGTRSTSGLRRCPSSRSRPRRASPTTLRGPCRASEVKGTPECVEEPQP